MPFRFVAVSLAIATLASSCQSSMFGRLVHSASYREANSARENPAAQSSDPWITDAGNVARLEHSIQETNDPLKINKYFKSEKARDIERNLGVGD